MLKNHLEIRLTSNNLSRVLRGEEDGVLGLSDKVFVDGHVRIVFGIHNEAIFHDFLLLT